MDVATDKNGTNLGPKQAEYNQRITDLIKEFEEFPATTAMDGVIHLLARLFVKLDNTDEKIKLLENKFEYLLERMNFHKHPS